MAQRRKPAYWLHKPTGRVRVRIDGKDHYLGEYGSPESRQLYDDLISEWLAKQGDLTQFTLTVADLCLLFVQWADGYYRHKDGTPTGTLANIQSVLRHMVAPHGATRVREFGPLKLKQVREHQLNRHSLRRFSFFQSGPDDGLINLSAAFGSGPNETISSGPNYNNSRVTECSH